jgi:hypothetical protein
VGRPPESATVLATSFVNGSGSTSGLDARPSSPPRGREDTRMDDAETLRGLYLRTEISIELPAMGWEARQMHDTTQPARPRADSLERGRRPSGNRPHSRAKPSTACAPDHRRARPCTRRSAPRRPGTTTRRATRSQASRGRPRSLSHVSSTNWRSSSSPRQDRPSSDATHLGAEP